MTPDDFGPDLPADAFDEPLPLWEAAAYAGVDPARIRLWKARGRITSPCDDEFGRPMYLLIDVWVAQDTDGRRKARGLQHAGQPQGLDAARPQ